MTVHALAACSTSLWLGSGNGGADFAALSARQFDPGRTPLREFGTFTFTVVRSNSSVASSVFYSLAHGTTDASDVSGSTSGSLNWAAGDTGSRTITMNVVADPTLEADETFSI